MVHYFTDSLSDSRIGAVHHPAGRKSDVLSLKQETEVGAGVGRLHLDQSVP